jgi:hypothetical protein
MKIFQYIIIGLFLIALIIFLLNNKNGCSPSEIKSGKSDTIITKIFVHDTLRDTVTHDSIRVLPIIKYRDTVTQAVVTVMPADSSMKNFIPDTTICYSIQRIEKDSAFIGVMVCSDSLPRREPLDLNFNIKYLPAPKTQLTIFRTDTLLKFKPIYQNWQIYAIAATTFALGMYFAHK